MATEIVDLDVLIGAPRRVKLGGREYKLPYDCPAELYLLLLRVAQVEEDSQEAELVEQLVDGVLELFQVHQPEMTALPPTVSLQLIVQLVGRVYGGATEETPDPTPEPAPAAAKTGTRSSARKSRSRSSA